MSDIQSFCIDRGIVQAFEYDEIESERCEQLIVDLELDLVEDERDEEPDHESGPERRRGSWNPRRLELLDWAAEADAIVIEDDYDSEYRYVGRPLPASGASPAC